MKVIARKNSGSSLSYICEVSHTELEKFLNLYYGKFNQLKEGDEIDLAKSYDFASDTRQALQTTENFINDHKTVIKSILKGSLIVVRANSKY